MKRVLITDFAHESLVTGLELRGFQVDYFPDIGQGEVLKIISSYDGLIINSKIKANQALIKCADRLSFVCRLGSGLEVIDQIAASSRKIAVINSPEGNSNAVAEHALGMLLALFNNIALSDKEVRSFIWNRELRRGIELEGRTIGIIGYGHTGTSFRRVLQGFNVKVLVYDKYIEPSQVQGPIEVAKDIERIKKESDIISFHLPLTSETKGMIDDKWINACKKGVYLINTSRGSLIHTDAIVRALESGRIGGACLDVFENEKPTTFSPEEIELYKRLYHFPNLILTPHVAGWTKESKFKIAKVLLEKIDKLDII